MATVAQTNLTAIRDSLIATVAAQTAAWEAAGCPPTFSIDGQSYDWNNWLAGKMDAIEKASQLAQKIAGPFIARSYGRP